MTDDRSSRSSNRYLLTGVLILLAVSVGMLVTFSTEASAQTGTCDVVVENGDSIQGAVNNASHGDTICVESGTYTEEVTLNVTGVSLVAADMNNPPVLDGTGLEVGVTIVNDSVVVDGFEIRNYGQWGIEAGPFTTSQDVSIRNNTIANNSNGLRAGGLTNGKVVNNTVVDNEGEFGNPGIQVWESHGIEIRGNNVSSNGDIGIGEGSQSGSDNSVIANNTLLDNGVSAINYRGSSSNVEITGNLVGGSNSGIRAGSHVIVRDNVVAADGIGISGASATEIVNNTVSGATTGISLSFASNAVVRDNAVTGARFGISVADTNDIGASDSANVTNNTASGNSVDLWLTGSEGVVVTDNTFETGVGIHSDPISRAEFVHTFENNTVQGDPLFYATGVDDPTVPDTVGQVIVVNATNVTVEGQVFDGVAAPVQVYFSDDAVIAANTISNDTFVGPGSVLRGSIAVLDSNGTTVRDNQLTGGTVEEYSIQVDGGREVDVLNNTISDPNVYGIHIGSFGVDHEVRNNSVSGAAEDGIHVTGALSGQGDLAGVVIADNQVSGSTGYGIQVRSRADGTRLSGNTVTQNGVGGMAISDSTEAWVEGNDLSQNDGAGLIVEGAAENATIVDNVADANLGPGIHVRPDPNSAFDTPDNVTVQHNEATNNDEDDQSFTASFYGIRIVGVQTAKVDNNLVSGNDRGGIVIEAATDVRVAHNSVADNGDVDPDFTNIRSGTGIHVIGSSSVTVNGNTVTNNPVHGIEVNSGASGVNVSYNNVEQNVRRGVFVENVNDVLLGHNIVRNNDVGIFVASITAGSSADSVILSSNLVELNTREGVIVTGTDELYGAGNDFLNNAVGVHLDGATTNATLRDNEISGNAMGINGSAADDVVDARENWWGADNGPSGGVADPVNGTLADGDGDSVSENVRFDPWSSEESQDGVNAGVIASSLVYIDGTEPDLENVSVDAFIASGLLQVQLVNTTADPSNLESVYELGGVGADETTVFQIEVQINSSAPRVLVGAGNVSEWDVVENGDGTSNVTVVVSPISQQQIVDCDAYDGCTPPLDDWPTGENDTATVANDATVSLAADPLTGVDAGLANLLNGTVLTTDAQAFGSPVYDPATEELSVFVAAPSLTVDDTQNEGFYRAFLPDALLDEWGVEDAAELKAAFDGEDADFDAEAHADGISITINMTYSAGEVTISTLEPASFDVGIANVNDPITEGETLTVDASVENTGEQDGTQTVALSIDGTEQDSTVVSLAAGESNTVPLSWSTSDGDAGDYTATVASDNDSAAVSVTLESTTTDSSSGGSSTTPTATSASTPIATPTPTVTSTPTPAATSSPTLSPSPTATPGTSGGTLSPEPNTAPPTVTAEPTATETPGQPGFGFLVTVLAVVLLGVGLSRRRSN